MVGLETTVDYEVAANVHKICETHLIAGVSYLDH